MTVYAEVNGTTLIKFPYTIGSLMEDNPYTNYGPDPDLKTIFPQTETAIQNGHMLVPVTYSLKPTFDPEIENCIQNSQPILVNNNWVLDWTITAKTSEEKQSYQQQVQDQNKAQAGQLLQATDWTEIPSVTNPANNPHLINGADFEAYRNALRAIAVNPPISVISNWPVKPGEQWST